MESLFPEYLQMPVRSQSGVAPRVDHQQLQLSFDSHGQASVQTVQVLPASL